MKQQTELILSLRVSKKKSPQKVSWLQKLTVLANKFKLGHFKQGSLRSIQHWPRGLTMCYYANKTPCVHSWTTCHKELTTCFSSGPIPLLADVSHLPAAVQHFRPFPLRVAAHSAERDDAGVSGGPVHRSEPETGKKGWKPRGWKLKSHVGQNAKVTWLKLLAWTPVITHALFRSNSV